MNCSNQLLIKSDNTDTVYSLFPSFAEMESADILMDHSERNHSFYGNQHDDLPADDVLIPVIKEYHDSAYGNQ